MTPLQPATTESTSCWTSRWMSHHARVRRAFKPPMGRHQHLGRLPSAGAAPSRCRATQRVADTSAGERMLPLPKDQAHDHTAAPVPSDDAENGVPVLTNVARRQKSTGKTEPRRFRCSKSNNIKATTATLPDQGCGANVQILKAVAEQAQGLVDEGHACQNCRGTLSRVKRRLKHEYTGIRKCRSR